MGQLQSLKSEVMLREKYLYFGNSKFLMIQCTVSWPGPDYPICTVCSCTLGPNTSDATPSANVKILMLKFVIEVWLKCIEVYWNNDDSKGHQILQWKNVQTPPKQCTLSRDRLIRSWCRRYSYYFTSILDRVRELDTMQWCDRRTN